MSLDAALEHVARAVREARGIPLTTRCVLDRVALLALVERVRADIPLEVTEAARVLRKREDLLAEASADAERLRAEAVAEAESARAQALAEAERVRALALAEAEEVRADAEERARRAVDAHEVSVAAAARAEHMESEARERADELVSRAVAEAATLRADAERHRDEALDAVTCELQRILDEVRERRTRQVGSAADRPPEDDRAGGEGEAAPAAGEG